MSKKKAKTKAKTIIQDALKSAGMSQWELADRLGMSEQSLSKKLRYELPQDELNKILAAIKER